MLRLLLRAVRHPQEPAARTSLLRHVGLKPRVFDVVSCVMQLADSRRLARIASGIPTDAFYARVKQYNAGVTLKKVVTHSLSEIARVLAPGGRLAFTSSYWPDGTYPGNHVSGTEVARMLERLGLRVRFYDARDKINSEGGLQTVHIFVVQKPDPSEPGFDRAQWSAIESVMHATDESRR